MLLKETYSEMAPKIPTPFADSLGAWMPGHGWGPQQVECLPRPAPINRGQRDGAARED